MRGNFLTFIVGIVFTAAVSARPIVIAHRGASILRTSGLRSGSSSMRLLCGLALLLGVSSLLSAKVTLNDPTSRAGYISLLLINEAPFPGEHAYLSVNDTKTGMLQILWVLHNRIERIPRGYQQSHIATVTTNDIIDVMTAGGQRGQVDGFYRDPRGIPTAVTRVHERVAYLTRVANTGSPGKFATLLNYAKSLGEAYANAGPNGPDIFRELRWVNRTRATGSAFSWMTDSPHYSPGGNFLRIPESDNGALAGNRFFTLKDLP